MDIKENKIDTINEGTNNFSFENRCVLVTDEDYEDGNVPELGEHIGDNRSYPSREVLGYGDYDFYKIVLTSGYYSGACIDYVEMENDSFADVRGEWEDYNIRNKMEQSAEADPNETAEVFIQNNIESFLQDIERYTNVDFNTAQNLVNQVQNDESNYPKDSFFFEKILDQLEESTKNIEATTVNGDIDRIKADFGYRELSQTGTFSNGEGVYQYKESLSPIAKITNLLEKLDNDSKLANMMNKLSIPCDNIKRSKYAVTINHNGVYGIINTVANSEEAAIEQVMSHNSAPKEAIIKVEKILTYEDYNTEKSDDMKEETQSYQGLPNNSNQSTMAVVQGPDKIGTPDEKSKVVTVSQLKDMLKGFIKQDATSPVIVGLDNKDKDIDNYVDNLDLNATKIALNKRGVSPVLADDKAQANGIKTELDNAVKVGESLEENMAPEHRAEAVTNIMRYFDEAIYQLTRKKEILLEYEQSQAHGEKELSDIMGTISDIRKMIDTLYIN